MSAIKNRMPPLPSSENARAKKHQDVGVGLYKLMIQSPEGKRSDFYFEQSQVLVGKSKNCDLVLDHHSVSYYHAIFLVDSESLTVVDVNSENGVIINGKRSHRQLIQHGDVVNIGGHVLFVEHIEDVRALDLNPPKFSDVNSNTEILKDAPPPLPVLRAQKHKDHLALIDGEWCDIKFADESYHPEGEASPLKMHHQRFTDYIDTEEKEIHHLLPESQRTHGDPMIEIIMLTHGNTVFFETFPLLSKVVTKLEKYLPHDLRLWNIPWQQFIAWDNNQSKLELRIPDGWSSGPMNTVLKETNKDHVVCNLEHPEWSIYKGVHQITVRYSQRVSKMGALRFWHGREDFFRATRNTLMLFLPFLFLLLIEIPVMEEPPVEEVVIYRPEVLKEKVEPKVVTPSASASNAANPEQSSLAQSSVEDRSKSEAQASQAKDNKQEEPKEVKPKITLAGQFKGLLGDKVDVSNKDVEANTGKKSSASGSLNGALGVSKGKLETTGGGSLKGLSASGELSGKGGFKGKGQGKSDFDSSFTATKTVVLGSIDPELLRKILREYIPQFRYCYQNELSNNPNLGGIIDLNFTLNGQGKVTSSKVLSKTGSFSNKGIGCIDGVLKSIPFPKPKGGGRVDVKQPLNFTSEKNKIN
jgi:pSer/pThr/pTyr-binding forkhead associated (FHA) protein